MMWLAFLAVALLGAGTLLFRVRADQGVAVDPVAHFRSQLSEIEADEQAGTIDPESAAAAKLELQRRLLKASKSSADMVSADQSLSSAIVGALAAGIVVVAAALYGVLGSPGAPAAPQSAAAAEQDQFAAETGMTLAEAFDNMSSHVRANPADAEAKQMLGLLARRAREAGDVVTAADAFGELAQLDPGQPNWRASELEAFIAHAGGQITPAARLVLAGLLSEAPDHPAGQYYLGLLRLQAGDEAGARAVWTALADRSAANAPWMPQLRRQLGALGVAPPALSADDIATVDAMTDVEREDFMQQMLARLESRLADNPQDPEGWLMLARSKLALGDREGAIAALEAGISTNPGENSAELQAFLDNVRANPDL